MNDFTKDEIKEHAKKNVERWLQYFSTLDHLKDWQESIQDDEPLHIGFRESDE